MIRSFVVGVFVGRSYLTVTGPSHLRQNTLSLFLCIMRGTVSEWVCGCVCVCMEEPCRFRGGLCISPDLTWRLIEPCRLERGLTIAPDLSGSHVALEEA